MTSEKKKLGGYFSGQQCLKRRASDVGVNAAIATLFCLIPPCWPIYILSRRSVLPICGFIFLSLASLVFKSLCEELFGWDLKNLNWGIFDLVLWLVGIRLLILFEQRRALKIISKNLYD